MPLGPPGSSSSPATSNNVSKRITRHRVWGGAAERTSIEILLDRGGDLAQVLDRWRHAREQRAVPQVAAAVHGPLERVALPTKDIVAVLPEPGAVCCQ